MSQRYLAKTTIESGRTSSWKYNTKQEDVKRRARERAHLNRVKTSEDFEDVHPNEYRETNSGCWNKEEKFTDKLGALKRWVASQHNIPVSVFWQRVQDKFSTSDGYTALDHIKSHIKGYIFDPSETPKYNTLSSYHALVLKPNGMLVRNKLQHKGKDRYRREPVKLDMQKWNSLACGMLIDWDNAWFWYDRKTSKRLARVSDAELRTARKLLSGGTQYNPVRAAEPISLLMKDQKKRILLGITLEKSMGQKTYTLKNWDLDGQPVEFLKLL